MKITWKIIVPVALLAVIGAVVMSLSPAVDNSSKTENSSADRHANPRSAAPKAGKAKNVRAKNETPIEAESGTRMHVELAGSEGYDDLSPEMKRLMDEIQLGLDTEDRKSLTKACEKIAKIQQERGRDAVPASVRAKAVEAIGLFLPASLAELVDFMADSDPEVVESVFDQLDNLLNDTTIGDKELSGMLVAMSKVLSDEDSIDSMAMAIDCNMRNSVKVATYCKIIETGTPEVVTRMKESIAEMMEVEVSDLPSNPKVLENQLNEWLEENPDGEDDADFYKGVDD